MIFRLPEPVRQNIDQIETGQLAFEVISCKQAALAKSIPIEQELKTLVLYSKTVDDFFAAHIRGGDRLRHRAVKSIAKKAKLGLRGDLSLASPAQLSNLNLRPGTVCPLLEPVWGMHHFIDKNVFSNPVVSTNDGTRTGYIFFPPSLLELADVTTLGDLTKLEGEQDADDQLPARADSEV